jgi:hypothetical protein
MAGLNESRTYDTGVAHGRALIPSPPPMWSYSSLNDVETCSRRYALSRADYPIYGTSTDTRLPNPATIKGDVVHGSLEIIVKDLVKAGCPSTKAAESSATGHVPSP